MKYKYSFDVTSTIYYTSAKSKINKIVNNTLSKNCIDMYSDSNADDWDINVCQY